MKLTEPCHVYNLQKETDASVGLVGHLSQEQELKLKALWYKIAVATQMLNKEEADKLAKVIAESEKDSKQGSSWGADTLSKVPGEIGSVLHLTPEKSIWDPNTLRQGLWAAAKLEHPDSLLLRYLRYRQW